MSRIQRYYFGKGNAMVEYALPAGIFVLGVGILATTVNINGLLGQFYAMANGDSAGAISGGRYSAKALGITASGAQGNGAGNFNISGGSGGFGPGIAMAGGGGGYGGFTSSGASSADSTGGAGQDEVLARLKGANNPMDVYNAIKDTPLPEKFKALVQSMAQQQITMSTTTDSKKNSTAGGAVTSGQADRNIENNKTTSTDLQTQVGSLNGTTLEMLIYAANPASARDLSQYGGLAAAALAKAYSETSQQTAIDASNSSDAGALSAYAKALQAAGIDTGAIVGASGATQMAQATLLKMLGVNPSDTAKVQQLLAMMNQNPPANLAAMQAAASGKNPAEVAEIAALSDGTCAAAAVCVEDRDKLMDEAKKALKAAQASIDVANQAAVDKVVADAAAPTTP